MFQLTRGFFIYITSVAIGLVLFFSSCYAVPPQSSGVTDQGSAFSLVMSKKLHDQNQLPQKSQ